MASLCTRTHLHCHTSTQDKTSSFVFVVATDRYDHQLPNDYTLNEITGASALHEAIVRIRMRICDSHFFTRDDYAESSRLFQRFMDEPVG